MTTDAVPTESTITDRRVALFAYAAGIVGLINVVTLALFYSLELNTDPPHIFGPLSDLGTTAFYLLILPVVWRFSQYLETQILGWIVIVVSIAGAIASLLLVLRALDFVVSTSISVGAIIAQCVWLVRANQKAVRRNAYWRMFGMLGLAAGGSILAGMVIIGIGLLLPGAVQLPFWIIGVVIGLLGWVSIPIWFLLSGRVLRRGFGTP